MAGSRPIAIYTRISLDREGTGVQPQRQESLCRTHLLVRDLPVGEVYTDRDVSAWTGEPRPGLEQMLAAIKAGEQGGVCVWKLDRLIRRFSELGDLLKVLTDADAVLLSVNESFDTSTAIGQALLGFVVAQAQSESDSTSLRVAAAEKARAQQGRPHGGGQRCYGYERSGEIIQEEAEQVLIVRDELKAGVSLRQATQRLNDRGSRTTTGREWTARSLTQLLKSPRLRGIRRYHDEEFKGDWEPIFTEAEHLDLLYILSSGYNTSPQRVGNQHLLTGLVACGECGTTMGTAKQGTHRRYCCRKSPGTTGCGKLSISMASLDDFVHGLAVEYANTRPRPDATKRPSLEAEVARIREELDQDGKALQEVHREKFYDRVAPPESFEPVISDLRNRIDANKVALETAAARLSAQRTSGRLNWIRMNDLPWFRGRPMVEQRAWIRQYIRRIEIDRATVRGAGFDPRRIRIEWSQGEPELDLLAYDESDAEAWNRFVDSR